MKRNILGSAESRILLMDGAMGTMIQRQQLGDVDYRGKRFASYSADLFGANDLLNLTQPDLIKEIHLAYLEAGADILVAHMGLTTSGSIGAQTSKTLDDCVTLIDEWASAAKNIREDIIVLCHGGPIAMPEDAHYILKNCSNVHGFYGASSMERLPTEEALTERTRVFKSVTF